MSIQSAAAQILGIAGSLYGGGQGAIAKAQAAKEQLTRIAKAIAAREFMYKLRGDNQQIDLESVATLRDGIGQKLSASA